MPSAKELAKALARQDSVTQQPRNRFLGAIADAAGYVSDQADRYVVPERDPLLAGMRGGDLLPFGNVARLLDDLSHGGRITTGRGQTTTLRPEVVDTVALGGMLKNPVKLAGIAALKNAAKQIHTGTGVLGSKVMNPRMSVVPEGASMPQQPTGLLGHPKLNVLPNERVALVEGNSNLRVEHKPDGTFTISHSPAWGETGKPFTLNGDSVDDLISTAESRLQRSEAAMTAAAKSKHSKTVGGMLEMKHGDNFEYAKSARSDSQYITHTPTGAKIRISDHKLPDVYESPDFEVSGALSKKEQAQSISKFLDDYATQRAKDDASIDVGGAMMQRPKTEFEILHDTAQRNAALPVEQGGLGLPANNTYIDRANAPGMFPEDAVHFSRAGGDYTTLDSGKYAIAPFDAVGTHVGTPQAAMERFQNTVGYKVNDPNYINDELKGTSYPVRISNSNPLMNQNGMPFGEEDLNTLLRQAGGHNSPDISGGDRELNAKLRKKLFEDQGYTNIPYFNEVEGRGSVSQIVPPSNIRSRFAAFDPFRRHEADILAGVGVGGMLDPQAIAEALRQQDRK